MWRSPQGTLRSPLRCALDPTSPRRPMGWRRDAGRPFLSSTCLRRVEHRAGAVTLRDDSTRSSHRTGRTPWETPADSGRSVGSASATNPLGAVPKLPCHATCQRGTAIDVMPRKSNAASELIKRYAEMAARLDIARIEVGRLERDLYHLQHTLRLLDPRLRPEGGSRRRLGYRARPVRGVIDVVYEVLNDAERPVTLTEVMEEMSSRRGWSMSSGAEREKARNRATRALCDLRRNGVAVSQKGAQGLLEWSAVERPETTERSAPAPARLGHLVLLTSST